MRSGKWPDRDKIRPVLKPYYDKQSESSLEDGILLWGLRVVITQKDQAHMLN